MTVFGFSRLIVIGFRIHFIIRAFRSDFGLLLNMRMHVSFRRRPYMLALLLMTMYRNVETFVDALPRGWASW